MSKMQKTPGKPRDLPWFAAGWALCGLGYVTGMAAVTLDVPAVFYGIGAAFVMEVGAVVCFWQNDRGR